MYEAYQNDDTFVLDAEHTTREDVLPTEDEECKVIEHILQAKKKQFEVTKITKDELRDKLIDTEATFSNTLSSLSEFHIKMDDLRIRLSIEEKSNQKIKKIKEEWEESNIILDQNIRKLQQLYTTIITIKGNLFFE